MVLSCFAQCLGNEGIVLAAFLANASSIFCRVGTDEDKLKSDFIKDDSINAKPMRRCHDTIKEFKDCLWTELNISTPPFWRWNHSLCTELDRQLKNIILSCLSENAAIFSGNDKVGYEVALSGQNGQSHPSCYFLTFGQKQGRVNFSEILSLAVPYLVCVMRFDFESICP
ncbi:hypothetical protein MLD38_028491 [Melastoma candidum]|uniref:Uncharacterized protein n=1 Tax=Melastoma candidum TaxID=119954 RepID=A0ACB9N190_9MYRT|nr:hypothetical protein MLD38_028491 [Melastoma candidum]